MKFALLNRLQRLENVRAVEREQRLEIQLGSRKKLPPDSVGERHIATVSRLPDGSYQWEERSGAPPANAADGDLPRIIRVIFVGAKDGSAILGDQTETPRASPIRGVW